VSELERTGNDLDNLLVSTNVPTIFLDPGFRIRRFTPATSRLFNLLPSDVNRPLADIVPRFTDPDLLRDAATVLDQLTPVSREIRTHDGQWYMREVLPYRVYQSESDTNQRNQAIGMLMFAYGLIKDNPAQATDLYTRQCSVNVNAKDLAVMAATLANGGTNPVTKKKVANPTDVAGMLAVMATAGLYDDSGKWLFHTGLPAKSGVGGGIIAVSPGKFGIAAFSPPLDAAGNSVRAQRAIADISNALDGNLYEVKSR
jgi:hypothetical protein